MKRVTIDIDSAKTLSRCLQAWIEEMQTTGNRELESLYREEKRKLDIRIEEAEGRF